MDWPNSRGAGRLICSVSRGVFIALLVAFSGGLPVGRAATIAVNAAPTSRIIDGRHFGLNTAVWDGSFKQSANIPFLRELGCTALRFPGGSTSDDYHWGINRSGSNTFTWATSFTD